MKTRLKIMALATVAALLSAPAMAQFQPTPNTKALKQTYQASIVGLVPAASATDFFTIQGSATKIVTVVELSCSGTSTATGASDVLLVKRSAANTTGTSTAPTAIPVDSNNAAGTAAVKAYTANPGALGTAVGTLRSSKLALPAPGSAVANASIRWQFGDSPYEQPIVLRGVAQTLAINGNAVSFGAGTVLDCNVTWTEN